MHVVHLLTPSHAGDTACKPGDCQAWGASVPAHRESQQMELCREGGLTFCSDTSAAGSKTLSVAPLSSSFQSGPACSDRTLGPGRGGHTHRHPGKRDTVIVIQLSR